MGTCGDMIGGEVLKRDIFRSLWEGLAARGGWEKKVWGKIGKV